MKKLFEKADQDHVLYLFLEIEANFSLRIPLSTSLMIRPQKRHLRTVGIQPFKAYQHPQSGEAILDPGEQSSRHHMHTVPLDHRLISHHHLKRLLDSS
jgi:hypothetical protein